MRRTELEREALGHLTASTAAWLVGMSDSGFRQARPPRGPDEKTYCARELVAWHVARRSADSTPDPMAVAGDSPALERWRTARAKLAELELAEKQQSVVRLPVMRTALGRWASILRNFGQRLQIAFGPAAGEMFAAALDDCERIVAELDACHTAELPSTETAADVSADHGCPEDRR